MAELGKRRHQLTGGAELHRSSEARSVAPNGDAVVDGPWAEATEQVGGFYTVETDDIDDLMECCKVLATAGDAVEVRRTVKQDPPS